MKAEKQNEVLAELKAKLEAINNEPFSVDSIMQEAKRKVDNALSWRVVKEALVAIGTEEAIEFVEATRDELSKVNVKVQRRESFSGASVYLLSSSGSTQVLIEQGFDGDVKPLAGNGDFLENVSSYWVCGRTAYPTIMAAMNAPLVLSFLEGQSINHQYHLAKNQAK